MAALETLRSLTHFPVESRHPGLGLFAGACLALLSGCTGDIGGEPEPPGPPGPPDVEPKVVPASPEVVESTGSCRDLIAGEQLVSVSPEGHAWLASSGEANGTTLRVLDAFDLAAEQSDALELSSPSQMQAWSARDGAALADDGLWLLEDLARVQLTAPDGFAAPARFCGDPGTNGFLVSSGQLFERRDDAQWWAWNPGAVGEAMPTDLLRIEGECQDASNVTWMTSPDGTLWRVEPTQYSQPLRFTAMKAAAATGATLAIIDGEELWVGATGASVEWQPFTFEGDAPTVLGAAGAHVWLGAGPQLLRTDGETVVEVSHLLAAPIEQILAHAGGVWIVGGGQICHQATSPMARVQGIRPFARSKEHIYPFSVVASDAAMSVSASLDGEPIDLTVDGETGRYEGEARLEHVGWHDLVLDVSGGGAVGTRSIMLKRLPEQQRSWAEDIAPLYDASCTGGTCHQAGSQSPPDISTYEAWVELAAVIQSRVVDAKTMPPPGSEPADWGEDDIATIAQWLQGGMLP